MMSNWYEPDGEVRFINQLGELFNAADAGTGPVASPAHRSRRNRVEVGAPFDVDDADDRKELTA
jgi:hypothetical protein